MAGRADGGDRLQPALVPHAEPQGVYPGPRRHQPRPRRLGARHRTVELLVTCERPLSAAATSWGWNASTFLLTPTTSTRLKRIERRFCRRALWTALTAGYL